MSKNEFIWRKISDKERDEISERAKEILRDFSSKLQKVEKEIKDIDVGVERGNFEREEGKFERAEIDRDLFFENAPNKDVKKGVIIAEKKKW